MCIRVLSQYSDIQNHHHSKVAAPLRWDQGSAFEIFLKQILILCFLRVRTVYELCQGELILDVANYDYANVFVIHPKRGEK